MAEVGLDARVQEAAGDTDVHGTRAPSPPSEPPASSHALGATVRGGVSWMTVSTIVNKALAVVMQVALGFLLIDEDFGVWGTAMGAATLLITTREFATSEYFVREGRKESVGFAGACFWIGLGWNVLCGTALAAAYPLTSRALGAEAGLIVSLLGAWLIISTVPSFLVASLYVDLRFRKRAEVDIASMIARVTSAVGLAALGFGALSFPLAWFAVSLTETAVLLAAGSDRFWKLPLGREHWRDVLRHSKWFVLSKGASGLINFGDYFVAGLLLSKTVVGLYYFAFNLIAQTGVLFASNLQTVLLPTLSRISEQTERLNAAVLRTLSLQALVTSPAFGLIAVGIDPLTRFIWGEKWVTAIPAMQALSLLYALRMTIGVTPAAFKAKGRFRLDALLNIGEGLAVMAAAGIAAVSSGEALVLTLAVGGVVPVTRFIICGIALEGMPGRWTKLARSLLPPWILSSAVACGFLWAATQIPSGDGKLELAIRLMVSCAAYALLMGVLIRVVHHRRLEEIAAVMPQRFARPVRVMLLLPRD